MSGLFKTGHELKQERIQDLAESNASIIKASGGTQREQQGKQLGGLLGTALAGAFMDKPGGNTAGDIEAALPEDVDLQTSKGLITLQRQLFDANDNESALSLNKHIKDALSIEGSQGKASGKGEGKASKVTAPSNNELAATRATLLSVPGEFGENLQAIQESGDVWEQTKLESMVEKMATVEKQITSQLRDAGKEANPLEVRRLIQESIEQSGSVSDGSFFGGFFGSEGVIDFKKQDKVLGDLSKSVFNSLNSVSTKPVETAPGTQTTGQVTPNAVIDEDIKGSVEDAGQGSPQGTKMEEATFESEIAPINEAIKSIVKSMKGVDVRSPQMKEMRKLRDKQLKKLKAVRKQFGRSVR